MKLRSLLVGIVVCFALGAFAPAAMAQDFCVGVTAPRCPAATYGLNLAALFQAVEDADADPGADTVVIAPHTFTLASSFSIAPGADTTIVGAGVGQTVFAGSVPGEIMFHISGAAGSSMSGFSVEVNDETANGIGLSVIKATVSEFNVFKSNDPFSLGFVGLEMSDGATARDGTVYVTANAVTAVHAADKSATLERVNVESEPFLGTTLGILADSDDAGAALTLRHVTIQKFFTAFSAADMDTTITDSVIDMGTLSFASGIAAGAYGTKTIGLDVARVTIVGKGADQTAIYLQSDAAPASIDANLYDFVSYTDAAHVSTYETLYCAGAGATQQVQVDVEYFASWGGDTTIGPGCFWDLDGTKTIDFINDGGPDFRDFDGGDYRLLSTSPLIDAGGTQGSLTSTDTDVAGANRLVDGDGDSVVRPDLGAHEYQRLAPVVSLVANQTTVKPGDEVAFSANVSDPEDETFNISWDFGDGATAGNQGSVAHRYAAIGIYNAAVTAIDDTGASTTVVKMISVLTPAPPVVPEPAATARITATAKKSLKTGKKGFSLAKKSQPSFSVKFANAAKAKFTLQSIGKNKKLKALRGSQTIQITSGVPTKFFFGGGKLKAGRYRVTITPISATGKAGAPASTNISLE